MIKMGILTVSVIFTIPGLSLLTHYILDLNIYKCANKCKQEKEKQLCYRKCKYEANKWIVDWLEKSISKCYKTSNPSKCRKNLFSQLKFWRNRMVKEKIKYENEKHKQKRRGKDEH